MLRISLPDQVHGLCLGVKNHKHSLGLLMGHPLIGVLIKFFASLLFWGREGKHVSTEKCFLDPRESLEKNHSEVRLMLACSKRYSFDASYAY